MNKIDQQNKRGVDELPARLNVYMQAFQKTKMCHILINK